MRTNETIGVWPSVRARKRSLPTGNEQVALTRFFRGQWYRTGISGLFHPSTYIRSRARRSARLDATCGLSIRPARKRSIWCCRYWELETKSRKSLQTYRCQGRSFSDESVGVSQTIPASFSGCPLEEETRGFAPTSLEQAQTTLGPLLYATVWFMDESR